MSNQMNQPDKTAPEEQTVQTQQTVQTETDKASSEPVIPVEKLRKREIKRLLLGSMTTTQEGHYLSGSGASSMPYGFREGALGVLLLGVRDKGIRFETTYRNNTQALYQTAKSMQNIGHIVELEAAPEAIACFVSSLVFRPVILLMEETGEGKEKKLALHAYCGRSLFSGFAIRRAVKRLEKELPKQIKRKGK